MTRLPLCVVALGLAAMAAVPIDAQTRIVVISDVNGSYGSTEYGPAVERAVTRIIELEPDLVISTGDMIAGLRPRPRLTRPELADMWSSFHGAVTVPFEEAGIPFAITPGNHDGSAYNGYGRERKQYRREWTRRLPPVTVLDDSRFPYDYSFAVDSVAFLSIDATTVGALTVEQHEWLADQKDLLAAYPVRIAFSHLPLLPFATGRETEIIRDLKLESLLNELDIDAYLSGHHHAYYPGIRDGTYFISQGALGAGPRSLVGTNDKSPRSFTVIDVTLGGAISVDAYRGPGFEETIPRTSLPARIRAPAGAIVRDDLAGVKGQSGQR